MMGRVASFTWRHPKLALLAVGAFALIAAIATRGIEDRLKAAGFTDSASESERATQLLRGELGYDPTPGLVVLIREPGGGELDITDPGIRTEVARLSAELADVKRIGLAVNPLEPLGAGAAPVPEAAVEKLRESSPLVADDGRSLVISGHLAAQDIEDVGGDVAEAAGARLDSDELEVGLGGYAPSFNEVNDITREDLTTAELIAFPALAILLLIVFRGVIAAGIPLLIGVISILGTTFVLRVMSEIVDTSVFALNITTALSLGLAVDYALLMVSRYREELERDGPTREAHRRTVLTAGRTVVFSGLTVAAAMAALVLFPQRFLYSVGVAGASVGVISSLVAVITVPAMLAILGERINALSLRRGPAVSDTSGRWYGLARGVMRRPVIVALASGTLLLGASAPLLWTELTGPSAEVVPPGEPSYIVNEYVEGAYPRSVTEAVTVTLRGELGDAELGAAATEIGAIDGVAAGEGFERASAEVAFASFSLEELALSARSQDAVHEIREAGGPGGAEVLVSGNTARFIDQKESLASHAPLVIAVVSATTLILLFLLTGSVLLPLKTLVMNALTLAATLGIIVLAFQEGLLEAPLDYTGPSAIEVTSLVFMFAIVFGLATDYAVLVMARIKEQHDLGLANEEAVAIGIAKTGRIITAAAVMIAVVFLAFSVSSVFFMKQLAIGQAAAVVIDATIVRALLVPSLMRILGGWNWWAPRPLRRLHERFGFSDSGEPAGAIADPTRP